MRTIINYLRQCFCKHELKRKTHQISKCRYKTKFGMDRYYEVIKTKTWEVVWCNKCGWRKKYRLGTEIDK